MKILFGLAVSLGVIITGTAVAQALSGEAKACENLHKSGQYDQAFSRCLKAASEGDALSQLLLAELYEKGRGVKQDKALAHSWYLRAAKLRNATGQYRVAQMYRDGIGVKADAARAKLWFEQARKSGYQD
jgi:TPR repeat protein